MSHSNFFHNTNEATPSIMLYRRPVLKKVPALIELKNDLLGHETAESNRTEPSNIYIPTTTLIMLFFRVMGKRNTPLIET